MVRLNKKLFLHFGTDSSGFGLPTETLNGLETVEKFLNKLESENLLSEDNLYMLQYLLQTTGPENKIMCKKVDEYAKRRETQPLRLKQIKRKAGKL